MSVIYSTVSDDVEYSEIQLRKLPPEYSRKNKKALGEKSSLMKKGKLTTHRCKMPQYAK